MSTVQSRTEHTSRKGQERSPHLITNKVKRGARIEEKRELVLAWLAGEPYSTAAILGAVLGLQRNATWKTLSAMQRAGLIRRETIQLPLSEPVVLWVLTPHGAMMGLPEDSDLLPHFQTGRVAPSTIEHGLDVQRTRLAALHSGWTSWQGDLELHIEANAKKWTKIPDALVTAPTGEKIALEVERTAKTLKRYRQILAEYLQTLKAGVADAVHYVCPTQGLAPRLARLFLRIEEVQVAGKRWPVTPAHRARFSFYCVKEWPPKDVTK